MKPELIRTVQMGPWTHKVDDGLETRKTAYETLYTLVSYSPVLFSHIVQRTRFVVGHVLGEDRAPRVPGSRLIRSAG